MSGTKAHTEREKEKRQAEIRQIISLTDNRTSLLNDVANYMHTKYGDTSFYNKHPLVTAILQSTHKSIVNREKLATDIENYQLPEVE